MIPTNRTSQFLTIDRDQVVTRCPGARARAIVCAETGPLSRWAGEGWLWGGAVFGRLGWTGRTGVADSVWRRAVGTESVESVVVHTP